LQLLVIAVVLVGIASTSSAADEAVLERLRAVGAKTSFADGGAGDTNSLTQIVIADGSQLTADDIAAIGRLPTLQKLQIHNCRTLDDVAVASLTGLTHLDTLALTNSSLTDAAVETISKAFPALVDLDLSSNANMTGASLKWISALQNLERLGLLQNRFNDLNTRRLAKLQALEVLDLRGNMEAGDMTLDVLGKLPKLRALKHRSTAITDDGIERLAASRSLEALLLQDFAITDAAGPALARIGTLASLEIFRCQGFGSEGVKSLAPLKKLGRLTLRDLPEMGDAGLAVLADLQALERLTLHELASVGDDGLRHLAAVKGLESLDIWSLPKMTDATVDVIAALPALKELSIRETGVTDAGLAKLAALPTLESLTFKNNGPISAATREKLAARKWKKLDLGAK
jgi:Leucine-rich repeat (LRR) protein